MLKLSNRNQLFIGLFLLVLLAVTRGEHFASIQSLPSASWAVFFLAGLYVARGWFFPVLLGTVAMLDYAAVTYGGVSSFCITPSYSLLILAYGALWFAGHKYASMYKPQWSTLFPLAMLMVGSGVVAEIISSGGFYYFSGRFADHTFAEMMSRFATYGPGMMSNFAFYIGCAALIHATIVAVKPVSIEDNSNKI